MSYIGNLCQDCTCKCIVLNNKCMVNSRLKISPMELPDLVHWLDEFQLTYLSPIIPDCLTEICAALELASLPTNDASYVAFPDTWDDLLESIYRFAIPAVDYIRKQWKGCDGCTESQYEAYERDLQRLCDKTLAAENIFKLEIEAFKEAGTYTCLPDDTDDCATDETFYTGYLWGTTKYSKYRAD